MTRETKFGLVVASSFVVLLGVVTYYKVTEPEETSTGAGTAVAVAPAAPQPPQKAPVQQAGHVETTVVAPGSLPLKPPPVPSGPQDFRVAAPMPKPQEFGGPPGMVVPPPDSPPFPPRNPGGQLPPGPVNLAMGNPPPPVVLPEGPSAVNPPPGISAPAAGPVPGAPPVASAPPVRHDALPGFPKEPATVPAPLAPKPGPDQQAAEALLALKKAQEAQVSVNPPAPPQGTPLPPGLPGPKDDPKTPLGAPSPAPLGAPSPAPLPVGQVPDPGVAPPPVGVPLPGNRTAGQTVSLPGDMPPPVGPPAAVGDPTRPAPVGPDQVAQVRPGESPVPPQPASPGPRPGPVPPVPAVDAQTPPVGALPLASSPPITAPMPPSAPAPAPAAVPTPTPNGTVRIHTTQKHVWRQGDSFAELARREYRSDAYAQALLEYNRDHPLAVPGLKLNPPVLQPGQDAVFLPNLAILEERFRQHIPGLRDQAPAAVPSTPGPERIPPVSVGQDRPSVAPPVAVATPPVAQPAPGGNGSVVQAAASSPDAGAKVVTVPQDMHLFEIARQTLRDGNRWTEIYNLNQHIAPERIIPAGTRLRLPADAQVGS